MKYAMNSVYAFARTDIGRMRSIIAYLSAPRSAFTAYAQRRIVAYVTTVIDCEINTSANPFVKGDVKTATASVRIIAFVTTTLYETLDIALKTNAFPRVLVTVAAMVHALSTMSTVVSVTSVGRDWIAINRPNAPYQCISITAISTGKYKFADLSFLIL